MEGSRHSLTLHYFGGIQIGFGITYGFCSVDLKRWLAKKDPVTGKKHGIATVNFK
jgi:type IV secretory pathway TrbD component